MSFEVKEIRDDTIAFNNLKGMDNEYYFYYDETNNIRTFKIRNNDLNAPINSNFVVGGVVHEKDAIDYDYSELIKRIRLQKSAKELKFKHIASGDFIECLGSWKLTTFLDWLIESDLYIHIFVLNLFYYSIVDIIDSAVANSKIADQLGFDFTNVMKSNLYTIAMKNEEYFIAFLQAYNYPNLRKEQISDFIEELIDFISEHENVPDLHIGLVSLRQILKESIKKGELIFLEDNKDNVLIDDFMHFYIQSVYMFINSFHEFDEESTVFPLIEEQKFTYNGKALTNYRQVKSNESKLVQISDVVVGIFGKFMDYVSGTEYEKLKTVMKNLESTKKNNLDKIVYLIEQSDKHNKGFLHYSLSNEDRIKLSWLGC